MLYRHRKRRRVQVVGDWIIPTSQRVPRTFWARCLAVVDRWERRFARFLVWPVGLAQILLVGLGWYTYEKTLVPLYKQAVLEDQVARYTLDLETIKAERVRTDGALQVAKLQLAETNKQATTALAALDAARTRSRVAEQTAASATVAALKASAEGEKAYRNIRNAVTRLVIVNISECVKERDGQRPTASTEECFLRIGSNATDALYRQLRDADWVTLEAALAKAAATYPAKVAALRATAAKGVEDTQKALQAHGPVDMTSEANKRQHQDLSLKASAARDRRAEVPVFGLARAVELSVSEQLATDWDVRP